MGCNHYRSYNTEQLHCRPGARDLLIEVKRDKMMGVEHVGGVSLNIDELQQMHNGERVAFLALG